MRGSPSTSSDLSAIVLISAVCFNAFLAIANGHGITLSRGSVIVAEMAIYAAAIVIIFMHADRRMMPWFLLTVFIILIGLLIGLESAQFNPKYVRDVLVIPVFIMLGMTYSARRFTTPFLFLHSVVFLVGVIEIASPNAYAEIFKVLQYYVNTRDFSANQFWNTESTLFVSATRPGARFFGFVDWHRASSIFLEPVSLGNYCVVAVILTIACWADLSRSARWYLVASTLFLLVACDGRLAVTSIGIVLLVSLVLRELSSRWSVLFLPIIVLAAVGYVAALGTGEHTDNFVGRVTGTVDALALLDFSDLFGMGAYKAESAADFGVVYFILSQSMIGVVVIWAALFVLPPGRTAVSRAFLHSTAIFVPLNLLVSYSFFSIKVAALLWFFYGYLYMREAVETAASEFVPRPPRFALRAAE